MKHLYEPGQRNFGNMEPFELVSCEMLNGMVYAADVATLAEFKVVVLAQQETLALREANLLTRLWEKRPRTSQKRVATFVKVTIDDRGAVIAASSTDRLLSLYEVKTGRLLARAKCGEIVTGMIFADNGRHLISSSSSGVIYVWKLTNDIMDLLIGLPSSDK